MKIRDHFQIVRFSSYLKLEILRNKKGLLLAAILPFGISFFMGLLLVNIVEQTVVYEHYENYTFVLLIGGFIISSLAFVDLGRPLNSYQYLTLPVSSFEKFLGMWFLTSICWIVLFTLSYILYVLFANVVGNFLFPNVEFEGFHPFHDRVHIAIAYYFVLQGIFLVGATHFRRYIFPKTILVFVFGLLILIFLLYLFIGDLFNTSLENISGPLNEEMLSFKVWQIAKWMFWWILAPLTWVIAYLGLKEKEA